MLLAEDHDDTREALAEALEVAGQTVEKASDGHEALAMLLEMPRLPDAVIVDVRMPRVNGLELLAAIRETERTRMVPVLLVSAAPEPQFAPDPIVRFMQKPFDVDEIVRALEALTSEPARVAARR